ncbi:MAG: P-II family nitrogen regulator [Candidatus Gastranaerophilales bacterium]|nr:P-II family nitrogen regulator [Candidatus Gastranaerophilales bacterium]
MNDFPDTTKLLAVAVNEDYGDYVLDVMRKAGVSGCTRLLGEVHDEKGESVYYDSQCILLSIINSDPCKIINAISNTALQDRSLKITVLLFKVFTSDRSTKMEPEMKLIVTIVNRIHTEELMSVARQAGAQGGTIIGARGTGTEEDAIFFGVRLAPEKEMLLILTPVEDAPQIIEAIKSQSVFNERGNGIVFTLNIEQSFSFNDK